MAHSNSDQTAPKRPYATMNIATTTDLCCDVQCDCQPGFYFHHCVWEGPTSEHVRCPSCQGVHRIHSEVRLQLGPLDRNQEPPLPWVYMQWKGTTVQLDCHCVCGRDFVAEGTFLYNVSCPECHRRWTVDDRVKTTKLSPDQATDVAFIHEDPQQEK